MRTVTTTTLKIYQDHKTGNWIVEKTTATTETREFENADYANRYMMALMKGEET